MVIFGTPVCRLTGMSPYLPSEAALGVGGIGSLRLGWAFTSGNVEKRKITMNHLLIDFDLKIVRKEIIEMPGLLALV